MEFDLHITLLHILIICMLCRVSFSANGEGGEGDLEALLSFKGHIIDEGNLPSWDVSSHFCNWSGISCSLPDQRVLALNLSGFQLSGTLSPSIGNLTFLRVLQLSYNSFYGTIPQELGKPPNLTLLDLSANQLTGAFPMMLHNITKLQHIVLDFNLFYGSIPLDFGLYLPNLVSFSVQRNQLTGPIPASIINASLLEIFDISFNQFSGQVPMDFGHLMFLTRLGFSNNMISSNKKDGLKFITSLTNCTHLNFLDLSSNNLQGILPNTVANLSDKLVTLRLDDNYIYGGFPDGLENLKSLGRLNFSHNHLTGTIPKTIGKVSSLEELYIGNNVFTGKIPSSIGNLSLLSTLTMRANKFSGGIPASLSSCTKLLRLDLSNNILTEAIPRTISSLTSLVSLSFAYNNLSGLFVGENVHISFNAIHFELLVIIFVGIKLWGLQLLEFWELLIPFYINPMDEIIRSTRFFTTLMVFLHLL